MGCVLARDLCDAIEGRRTWSSVREMCGSCSPRMVDGVVDGKPLET
jgi:hypothetical protein